MSLALNNWAQINAEHGPGLQSFRRVIVLVCVEVLRPSQPNGVMPSADSLPNHTFNWQA